MDSITLTVNGQQINVSQTNVADLVNKHGFDVVVALLEAAILYKNTSDQIYNDHTDIINKSEFYSAKNRII